MKKLLLSVLASATLLFTLSGFNFALDAKDGVYVYDDGDYLPESEEVQIQQAIESVREKTKTDILVYFTGSPDTGNNRTDAEKITQAWADGGRGYGDAHNTVLLYVNMDENNGRGMYIDEYSADEKYRLEDAEIDAMIGGIYDYLVSGRYGNAAYEFVTEAADYAKPGFFETIWSWLLIGLSGGGIAAKIGVGSHKAKSYTSKRHYLSTGSVEMTRVNDSFAGTTTVVREIPRVPENTGGGGVRPSGGGLGGNNFSSGAGSSAGHHGGGKTF